MIAKTVRSLMDNDTFIAGTLIAMSVSTVALILTLTSMSASGSSLANELAKIKAEQKALAERADSIEANLKKVETDQKGLRQAVLQLIENNLEQLLPKRR